MHSLSFSLIFGIIDHQLNFYPISLTLTHTFISSFNRFKIESEKYLFLIILNYGNFKIGYLKVLITLEQSKQTLYWNVVRSIIILIFEIQTNRISNYSVKLF